MQTKLCNFMMKKKCFVRKNKLNIRRWSPAIKFEIRQKYEELRFDASCIVNE